MSPVDVEPSRVVSALERLADRDAVDEARVLRRQRRVHVVGEHVGPRGLAIQGVVLTDGARPCEPTIFVRGARVDSRCACNGQKRPCSHVLAVAQAWQEKHRQGPRQQTAWRPILEALAGVRLARNADPGQEILVHWVELVRRGQGPWELALRWRVHRAGARGIGRGRPIGSVQLLYESHPVAEEDARVFEAALPAPLRSSRLPIPVPLEVRGRQVDPVVRALAQAPWVRWEGEAASVEIEPDPVHPILRAEDLGSEIRISIGWAKAPDPSWDPGALRIVGSAPPWVECAGVLRPVAGVADGDALHAVLSRDLSVPPEELPSLLGTVAPALELRGVPVEIVGAESRNLLLSETPKPRLYLSEERGVLVGTLRFGYGDYEVAAENPQPLLTLGGRAERVFLRRDIESEFQAATRLRALGFRMAEPGRFEMEGDSALDFVLRDLDSLAAEWEVFGRDGLRKYRVSRVAVTLGVRLGSELDWLDLRTEFRAGGDRLPSEEVLKAFRAGSRYVRLGTGAHALLGRAWLQRMGTLLAELGLEADEARVAPYMVPVVEELLETASSVEQSGQELWERLTAGLRDQRGLSDAPVPAGFRGTLRPYQEAGYRWLRFLGERGLGGILADDMGLGKTVQTLALLLGEVEAGRVSPSLVVAPTSVVPNWEAEARRFSPQLRVLRYHGTERKAGLPDLDAVHLVITSYAILRRDVRDLGNVAWNYAILDEAQAIKNAATQTARAARKIKARRRLTLTGTPLENHLGELWSQVQFLMPGLLGSERHFTEKYARPIAQGNREVRASLARRIRPFVLRRLKSEVASELPEKVESVLLCQMGPEQERLYRSILAASRERVFREVADRGFGRSRLCVLDALLRLRQTCCHPAILPADLGREAPSAKFELFCDFVSEVVEEGHRVLVFTQFVKVLEIMRRWFDEAGIPHLHLDGRTRDREERVRRFQEDPSVPVFLVSLKAGGTGLNLTAADYVILYDPWWNPAVEAQAADRAHRIGQTRKVFAYKLITQGTVEEKILALQERKKSLTDDLIRSEEQWGQSFTEADLEELFRL